MVLDAIRDSRPTPNRFRWIEESTQQLPVFITFLVGAGAIVSAVAWLVDRIAGATATPALEGRLARRLTTGAYPTGGLLVDNPRTEQLRRPR